jgi:glucose dehydrogenase
LLICLALVSLLLIYKDGRLGEYRFWASLLLYSLLILGTIMIGNSELGVNQAVTAKRYTTFPILAVVGVYALLAKTVLERRSIPNTVLLVALSGVILLSTAISYREGIKKGREERAHNEEQAYVLYTYESQPDDALSELMRRTDVVRNQAPTLKRLGYNVFSGESQAPKAEPDP